MDLDTPSAEKYDPSYQTLINEFPPVTEEMSDEDLLALIKEHGFKFIMPKTAWMAFCRRSDNWYEYSNHDYDYDWDYNSEQYKSFDDEMKKRENEICLLAHQSYYQFNFTRESLSFLPCRIKYKLLLNDRNGYYRDITLPHDDLGHAYAQKIKAAYSPISKEVQEQFSTSMKLFKKIMSAQSDEEQWIEALKEVEDILFVMQNIEYRLGCDMLNKKLWKLYMAYLKDDNPTIMLHTYSKYCRFWTDDVEMKKEYETQLKIHGPISVPWSNLFDFEMYDLEAAAKLHKQFLYSKRSETTTMEKLRNHYGKNSLKSLYFSTNGMVRQNFSFKNTVINYICKNANAAILMKLSSCCKALHSLHENVIPCYKLTLEPPKIKRCTDNYLTTTYNIIELIQQSARIWHKEPANVFRGKKLAISKRLFVHSGRDRMLLSNYMPKIHSCEAKYLELQFQHLTFKEYKFLTEKAVVLELILKKCKIVDEDKADVPLEDLLEMILNVQFLEIGKPRITANTTKILSELPFKSKFERFYLWKLPRVPEANDFSCFIKKNFHTNCKVKINFASSVNMDDHKLFIETVGEALVETSNVFNTDDWHLDTPERYVFYEEDPMWVKCPRKRAIFY